MRMWNRSIYDKEGEPVNCVRSMQRSSVYYVYNMRRCAMNCSQCVDLSAAVPGAHLCLNRQNKPNVCIMRNGGFGLCFFLGLKFMVCSRN